MVAEAPVMRSCCWPRHPSWRSSRLLSSLPRSLGRQPDKSIASCSPATTSQALDAPRRSRGCRAGAALGNAAAGAIAINSPASHGFILAGGCRHSDRQHPRPSSQLPRRASHARCHAAIRPARAERWALSQVAPVSRLTWDKTKREEQ